MMHCMVVGLYTFVCCIVFSRLYPSFMIDLHWSQYYGGGLLDCYCNKKIIQSIYQGKKGTKKKRDKRRYISIFVTI
jgi:hypothetical protein